MSWGSQNRKEAREQWGGRDQYRRLSDVDDCALAANTKIKKAKHILEVWAKFGDFSSHEL